jgi:tetratricopeptide (TPR) repeat protein
VSEDLLEAARTLPLAEAEELAATSWRHWLEAGDPAGGRAFLAIVLERGGAPTRARALALYGDGLLAFRQGEQEASRARNEEALAAARAVGAADAEALALVGLSRVAFREGDYARTRELASQARAVEPGEGVAPLHLLAAGTRLGGDLDAAAALYEESLALNRRLGDQRMVAIELHNLGHVEVNRGNLARAEELFAECATLRNLDAPYEAAMAKLNAAALACASGERARAAESLGEVESMLATAGIVLDPDDAFEVEQLRRSMTV